MNWCVSHDMIYLISIYSPKEFRNISNVCNRKWEESIKYKIVNYDYFCDEDEICANILINIMKLKLYYDEEYNMLKYLHKLKNLTYLDISASDVTDEGMKYMSNLINLTHLDISACDI